MTNSRIVAHSLVLWSATAPITQEDKDFFDTHVEKIDAENEFMAAYQLVALRFAQVMNAEQAKQQAKNLIEQYAEELGEVDLLTPILEL